MQVCEAPNITQRRVRENKKRIIGLAVAKDTNRTAYDVSWYSCRTKPPKIPHLG